MNIYEFNTETYFKKNLKPFNTGVNLDGLEAKESLCRNYDEKPNILHKERWNFPSLAGKIGLFIIEFIGNGVSARAVIKKGSLSLVHRSTIAGHRIFILDENKDACTGERTGVWFDGQYFPANKERGDIFIPYGKSTLTCPIIMVHNDFAQLANFTRKTESYELEM